MKKIQRMGLISRMMVVLLLLLSSSLVAQNLIVYGNFDANQWQSFDTDYEHSYGLGGDHDTGKFYLGSNAHDNGNQMFSFPDHHRYGTAEIYDCKWPHAKQQTGLGHDSERTGPFLL